MDIEDNIRDLVQLCKIRPGSLRHGTRVFWWHGPSLVRPPMHEMRTGIVVADQGTVLDTDQLMRRRDVDPGCLWVVEDMSQDGIHEVRWIDMIDLIDDESVIEIAPASAIQTWAATPESN